MGGGGVSGGSCSGIAGGSPGGRGGWSMFGSGGSGGIGILIARVSFVPVGAWACSVDPEKVHLIPVRLAINRAELSTTSTARNLSMLIQPFTGADQPYHYSAAGAGQGDVR